MEKEYKKGITLLLVIAFLLIGYLLLTNFIETKKIYSQDIEWFTLNIGNYVNNNSCIEFQKTSLSYYNDITKYSNKLDNRGYENLLYVYIPIEKRCDFKEFWITISATNISFNPKVTDRENLNLTYVEPLGNDKYKIFIKNDSWEFYELEILIPIKEKFFTYYRINNINELGFVFSITYKNSIFNGYLADESSFNVKEGRVVEDNPIFSDTYKSFNFDEDSALIRFNPKSKPWFLFQKILDALILGVIAVLIYEFGKNLTSFKKLFKDINHLFKVEKEKIKDNKKDLDKGLAINKNELSSQLKRIEESVNLGTFDNTVLALMIFLFATGLSLISSGFLKLVKSNQYLIAGTILFFVLIIPLLFYFVCIYSQAIFTKKQSFFTRVLILTLFEGVVLFVVCNWIFLWIASGYERWFVTPSWVTYIIEFLLIVGVVLISIFYSYPKLWEYFNKEFEEIIAKRRIDLNIKK